MKTTSYQSRVNLRLCRLLLATVLLVYGFTNNAAAQAPYVTITSGNLCYGTSTNLGIFNATATSWTVSPNIPGGLSGLSGSGVTINAIATGTFTLTVYYINGPASQPTGSLTLTTTIYPPDNPSVTVTSPSTACQGEAVTFYPWVNGVYNYYSTRWYVDNVFQTSTYYGTPFTTSSLSAGSHTIRCEAVPNSTCYTGAPAIYNKTITITGTPTVSPNVSICPGGSTTLTATGSASYTWSPATGLSATTGASVVASPSATTTYTVTYGSCSPPKQVTVTVNQPSALAGSPCGPPSGTPGGTYSGTSVRNGTPVVLKGSDFGATPVNTFAADELVAFIYKASIGNWQQVPLQVDERKTVNGGTIYNTATTREGWSSQPYSLFSSLQYCDANTWVGTDATTTFDNDDEVVFMARDAGGDQAPVSASYPTGVQASAGAMITVTDGNNPTAPASYIYIFKKSSTGGLQQSAGKSYVNYNFSFKVGTISYGPAQYKANYTFGHHPENSTVTSPFYQIGFSDRWIEDVVKVTVDNSLGVDMVDRHRNQFKINSCHNEDNFTTCAGAYIVNKSGPVRAIRSHMGACSGPLTQREFLYYDQFEVIRTDLRVHQIPGMMDFWDYSPLAGNMRYSNNNNTTGGTLDPVTGQTGIPVDGSPDVITAGPLTWQMMSSASGTIFRHYKLTHNITPLALTSYYLDTNTPSTNPADATYQCTGGDGKAWGSSGMYINQEATYASPHHQLPNTDPRFTDASQTFDGSNYQNASLTETNFFLKPATSRTQAAALVSNIDVPLTAVVSRWPAVGGRMAGTAAPAEEQLSLVNHSVSLYPNPSNGVVTVDAKGAASDKIIALFYNPTGKQIKRIEGLGSLKQIVDLQAPESAGQLYVVKVHIGKKVYTHKLMVTK
ncbi:hypothetical protein DJ568_00685 [Mucilaginibacter hurinus]|uniref:Secretion system C-terminal sorting domain-containing protein n=1 Tax=Mucilaginibacter hurinus TaxID=2201324 RepID=A0A367GSM2_9SPHI|nr:T9SS type A sorting domain-containing protein [Mucilaginibacter hurinus]RCH56409.1 hypothetical protein DJ568_00685 [Mucilaginibacter hurinus]